MHNVEIFFEVNMYILTDFFSLHIFNIVSKFPIKLSLHLWDVFVVDRDPRASLTLSVL